MRDAPTSLSATSAVATSPFAERHRSGIYLSLGLVLLAAGVAAQFVGGQASLPCLVLGAAFIFRATNQPSAIAEALGALGALAPNRDSADQLPAGEPPGGSPRA